MKLGSRYTWRVQFLLSALAIVLVSGAIHGSLEPVSVRDIGLNPPAGGNGDSGLPILSTDGRFVLFASTANNLVLLNGGVLPVERPPVLNVYLRDRNNQTTTLVSINSAGTGGGDGDSIPRGISADGRYVLFESAADNLVPNDTNNASDVFVRDLVAGTTRLVSATPGGVGGNGDSYDATLTPDGRYVAFVSAATNLVAGDTNGIPDVFVRDLQAHSTVLASPGAAGIPPGTILLPSGSELPELTPDGHYVAFFNSATNLIPGVTNAGEVYVRDLVAGTTAWASSNAQSIYQTLTGYRAANACNFSLSTNGQIIAFEVCSNLGGAASRNLLLRYDRQAGTTDIVSTNANLPRESPWGTARNLALTPDGRFLAYVANTNGFLGTNTDIYLWDAQLGSNVLVSTGLAGPVKGFCDHPAIDTTGRYVAFLSNDTNLTTDPVSGSFHVYRRDVQAGTTTLVDAGSNGPGSGVNPNVVPGMSGDGQTIAFQSPDGALVSGDNNRADDVFVHDFTAQTTEMVSVHDPSQPSLTANGFSELYAGSVSSNGQYVAFASDADNLVPDDTNGVRDIFVRDRVADTTVLVSADTNGHAAASSMSSEPAISGNGRYVAFSSFATNLAAGDTNRSEDVFVRDLLTGTTALVSVNLSGGFARGNSSSPLISADGRYVVFQSYAPDLATGPFSGSVQNVFVRDLVAGTTHALSTLGGGYARMTPDGRYVAFMAVVNPNEAVEVWDTQAASLVYTSPSIISAPFVNISPDGRWLVYLDTVGAKLDGVDLTANTNWVINSFNIWPYFFARMGLQFSRDGRYLSYAIATNASLMTMNVYLYDFQTGSNALISQAFNSANAANDASDTPVISADGRYIAYRSLATNVVSGDLNSVPDVFLYDRLSQTTTLLTVNETGLAAANNRSLNPVFSGDGKTLFFQSWASDLAALDGNAGSDLFALSLAAPAFIDTDGDGMDDQWELDHFGTLARDGTGDYDGDGVSDLDEFLAGTDPTDPTSAFLVRIVYSGTAGLAPALTWPAAPGRTYQIQFKNSLEDPNWQPFNGRLTLLGGTGYAQELTPTAVQRFYRVVLMNY